jgi:hypothetical protein
MRCGMLVLPAAQGRMDKESVFTRIRKARTHLAPRSVSRAMPLCPLDTISSRLTSLFYSIPLYTDIYSGDASRLGNPTRVVQPPKQRRRRRQRIDNPRPGDDEDVSTPLALRPVRCHRPMQRQTEISLQAHDCTCTRAVSEKTFVLEVAGNAVVSKLIFH